MERRPGGSGTRGTHRCWLSRDHDAGSASVAAYVPGKVGQDEGASMSLDRAQRERTSPASRPEVVWLLRDHLAEVIEARGEHPHPYTHLTDEMRAAAERWFPSPPSRRARR